MSLFVIYCGHLDYYNYFLWGFLHEKRINLASKSGFNNYLITKFIVIVSWTISNIELMITNLAN